MLTVSVSYPLVSVASYLISNIPARIVALTHLPFPHVYFSSRNFSIPTRAGTTSNEHYRSVHNFLSMPQGVSANDEVKKEVVVVRSVCSIWRTAEPNRMDYATVVGTMNANRLVGDANIFERAVHVPVTHMEYIKPNFDAILLDLKAKDLRSAKEWEYVNGTCFWMETGLAVMEVAKRSTSFTEMARNLVLAETSFKAALEVLSMRGQYFRDIMEHGV